MTTPDAHVLLIGLAGSGKSTVAAAGKKPMRVVMCDPVTDPYTRYGEVVESEGTAGQLVKQVMSRRTGKLLIHLDCFWDADPNSPQAWMQFFQVKTEIIEEVYAGRWMTTVLDSATGLRDICNNQKRYRDMVGAGVGEIARVVTDELEPFTTGTMPMLPRNTIALMHLDEFMVEESVGKNKIQREKKVVLAPGRLRRSIPSKFGEVYRLYWNQDGELEMQTKQRGHAGYESCRTSSVVDAPDGAVLPPDVNPWSVIWSNWAEAHKEDTSGEGEAKHDGAVE